MIIEQNICNWAITGDPTGCWITDKSTGDTCGVGCAENENIMDDGTPIPRRVIALALKIERQTVEATD